MKRHLQNGDSKRDARFRYRAAGFTLIEMLVVLVVIAALMGIILTPLSTQVRLRQMKEEERNLHSIEDALIGFAQTKGFLPCPDTPQGGLDGVADYLGAGTPGQTNCNEWRAGVAATKDFGLLPFATLGLPATDRWGRRYFYRVDPQFVLAAQVGGPGGNPTALDLDDNGSLSVTDRTDVRAGLTAINIAAVVISIGVTGYCGYDGAGVQISHGLDPGGECPPDDAPWSTSDEANNLSDTATVFYSRTATDGNSTCDDADPDKSFCHYDDQLIWLSAAVVKTRLIDAGRLP